MKKKRAIIITAFARFIKSFLTNDILILQRMGYEVHCAANINHAGAECMLQYFKDMNVVFHQIDFSSNKPLSRKTLVSYKQMRELYKQTKFDLIHCHTPIAGAIARMTCAKQRKKGAKVIYTTHGFYFHKHSSKKTWLVFHTVEDFMSRYSDAIITINKEDYANAQKMHCKSVYYIPGVGVDTQKFISVGVDRDEYRKRLGVSKEDFLVLAVGELSQRKNHQIIIKALAECKIPNALFMICGNAMTSTNTKEELESLAKEMQVDLRLMGLRDDIPQICKCADVGVMPSTREGLGLSGIEMLASGLPVVASDVHGIVDYIENGVDGFLCDPFDSHAFAVAIGKLQVEEVRQNMKPSCVETAKKFDKCFSFAEMERIYSEVLS
ncbi:glycosyltransferase [Pseudobacteroides cellulosolvens]|uniref:Glycosyl transferase group 1 n=1 Tax=Pseudobacteroides cellulosolvens ATCC 35603 = DSM 2933 TaxID=398512 RepID=A0A0L6JLE4_9FIRM|nr:glycosyltransferase [Pseudobacteroides cellulosolvens]KNY26575.1 glycosyl transferase group 1 [Pseudobacteroides cellulosolvens ATCC 35603 = DSM 2933]